MNQETIKKFNNYFHFFFFFFCDFTLQFYLLFLLRVCRLKYLDDFLMYFFIINWLTFNVMAHVLQLFYADWLVNKIHCTFMFLFFFSCFLRGFFALVPTEYVQFFNYIYLTRTWD